ncbi:type II 3-dehydroquinate dehydratase [Virgibacillus sp. 179-BFC.A HS]|uniref:3-dehydroquinate dehydratase n=1 Tax=Tigheibacillus jepli TaxID=3035914 RepID=A0ABU5CGY9_9BACI|nr:type II 3-dehydroquinate dehydratase [Virgibacillus sp. 179-BFC.A HS]MDY0405602.1 type II 3-dehydroquinate dehydratase [Virgibacillus sp. 179-BFC.A HS]
MKRLLLLNGPNINLLGKREENIYGSFTLADIEMELKKIANENGFELDTFQSNHEGDLVDKIQQANSKYNGIIFNPAAYTHTSIALRDAILAIDVPVIEVHISNIHSREAFRHQSMLAPACAGQIVGLGKMGYRLACIALMEQAKQ